VDFYSLRFQQRSSGKPDVGIHLVDNTGDEERNAAWTLLMQHVVIPKVEGKKETVKRER
jgi:hypothetical protein